MINPINHYSIENHVVIHDEEALTSSQLLGRLTGKVNEVINYVNQNLGKIDAAVAAEVAEHIRNGTFTQAISTYCNALEKRIDQMIGKIPVGSTTMDAEVIDGRVGADGTQYSNIGAAIRTQVDMLRAFIKSAMIEDPNNLFDPFACEDGVGIATANGNISKTAANWLTDYIPVKGGFLSFNTAVYKIAWFNANKVFLECVTNLTAGTVPVPTGATFARICFYQGDAANMTAYHKPFADRFDVIVSDKLNVTDVHPRWYLNPHHMADLVNMMGVFHVDANNLFDPLNTINNAAITSNNGMVFESELYWITDFIATKAVGVLCSHRVYKKVWYDADKKVLGAGDAAPAGSAYLRLQFLEEEAPYARRFDVVVCDGARELSGVKPRYYIPGTGGTVTGAGVVNGLGDHLFTIPLTNTPYMSDHTFINGQLYAINASADDHLTYAPVTVYDVNVPARTSQYVRTIQHNLGHANSIDYSEGNGCLILGDGSNDSTLPGAIYILDNAASRDTWRFQDCVKIDLTGKNWGIKVNVVWGESNNGNHNIAYVISNNNANIRKILLQRTNGKFNGQYVVLGEWTGAPVDVNQGSVFRNGKLYTAIGHSQLWMLEHTLNDDGTITVRQFKDRMYDETGNLLTTPFTEGLTMEYGCTFLGASSGDVLVYGDKAMVYRGPVGSGDDGPTAEETVILPAGNYFANEILTKPGTTLRGDIAFLSCVPNTEFLSVRAYNTGNVSYGSTTVYTAGAGWRSVNDRLFIVSEKQEVPKSFYSWFTANYRLDGGSSGGNDTDTVTIEAGEYTANGTYDISYSQDQAINFEWDENNYIRMICRADEYYRYQLVFVLEDGNEDIVGEDGSFLIDDIVINVTEPVTINKNNQGFKTWFDLTFTKV